MNVDENYWHSRAIVYQLDDFVHLFYELIVVENVVLLGWMFDLLLNNTTSMAKASIDIVTY